MVTINRRGVQFLNIETLSFDPENPRLPSRVTPTDEAEVLDFMITRANVIELMGSISSQGFFPGEPLLVVPDPHNQDNNLVVEGNRRLAAVKLLLSPDSAPSRQRAIQQISDETEEQVKNDLYELPVLVFDRRDEILSYLGYRHITGIQTWGPLAKAEYLDQLLVKKERELQDSNTENGEISSRHLDILLAKEIGSRSNHVGQLLSSLAVYRQIKVQDFFGIDNLNEETLDFGVLYTAIGYAGIHQFIGLEGRRDRNLENLNIEHLANLTKWLFQQSDDGRTVLGESRDLDKLDFIVQNEQATQRLRDGHSLEAAYTQSQGPSDTFLSSLKQISIDLNTAWSEFRLVENVGQTERELIAEIVRLSTRLRASMEDAL